MNSKRSEIVIVDNKVYHLGLAKGQLAENVFIVGDPARAVRVSKRFDVITSSVNNREYLTFTGTYKGMPATVIGTGIGTDNVEIALVEAYILNEFDFETASRQVNCRPLTIIRIGTSGGVQANIAPGVFGISSYALGLDSTGPYYDFSAADKVVTEIEESAIEILGKATPIGFRFKDKLVPYASKASETVTTALIDQARRQKVAFAVGITASSPSFYGASSRFIEGLTNTIPDIKAQLAAIDINGTKVINMEMESSLMFHLCGQMNYQAGTICPIISNPATSDAVIDYDNLIEMSITIGLEAMVDLKGTA
ncbi:MAG: hypothetical protein KA746_07015 [Pyrinomonadaceae bacterium]|nr:hypothetical protein [Pyrinomonadaceae bacterium]